MKPLVSILIPSYNAVRWLEKAVESSLSQTWTNREVIVIDDGSIDGSQNLLKPFGEKILLYCRENRGGNPTRNELLSLANGDWVQFLDADDLLLPEKIAAQMATVVENPAADVIYSPQIIEHHRGRQVIREHWDPHDPNGDHDPWAYHLGWKLTQTGGALFRKKALLEVGGWNETQERCQDNEVYFRLLKHGARFERCAQAGSVYRRFEGGSVSTTKLGLLRGEILRLLREGEIYLRQNNQLTRRRLQALNGMRFRLARDLWKSTPREAIQLHNLIHQTLPEFVPGPGEDASRAYRLCYRTFGFKGAEKIAAWTRPLREGSR